MNTRFRSVRLAILAGLVFVGGVLFGQEAKIIRTKTAPAIVRSTPDSGGNQIKALPMGSVLEVNKTVPDKSSSSQWFEVAVVKDNGDRVSGYLRDLEADVVPSPYSDVPIRNWVNDAVGLLAPEEIAGLTRNLAELDENDQSQVVLLVIDSYKDYKTPDATFEAFASSVFNSYHIGRPERNDGILVLVGLSDRKIRISLGVGYEFAWEGKMDAIINDIILPSFRTENYGRGILDGVKAVIDQVKAARKSS